MSASDRIILKTWLVIIGAMCLGILVASWVSAADLLAGDVPPVLCQEDIRVPMEIEVTDPRTCAYHGKGEAPCIVQCGRVVIKKGCKRMTWRGCDGAQMVLPQPPMPSPTPSRSPAPTASPNGCETKDPAYCWAKGSRLSIGGGCWSNCSCILRGSGECAQ